MRERLSGIVLDDAGDAGADALIVVTAAGAEAVRTLLGVELAAEPAAPFLECYAAPRWALLLLEVSRSMGPKDCEGSRLAFIAGRCRGDEGYRAALFAAWQLDGVRAVVALIRRASPP